MKRGLSLEQINSDKENSSRFDCRRNVKQQHKKPERGKKMNCLTCYEHFDAAISSSSPRVASRSYECNHWLLNVQVVCKVFF